MTQILIVEDDPMARKLFELFAKEHGDYHVVRALESAAMAEFYCLTNPIDLILMDVCTAMHANGLDYAVKIKKNFPKIKIIIVNSQPECSFLDRARAAGVDSFWYKDSDADSILDIMERTLAGESIYPDSTPVLRLGNALSPNFTDRELEVLREVTAGEPDAVIAEHLHMSLRTVKAHIQSMRDKTGFRNRTELAVRARESGLIINDRRTDDESGE